MSTPYGANDLWLFIGLGANFISRMFKLFFGMFSDNIFLMFPLIAVILAMGVLAWFRVVSS